MNNIKCFVMMPFGKNDNESKYWKDIYKLIIEPSVKYDHDFIEVLRVDLDPHAKSGNWLKRIIEHTYDSEIVIADVTGLNPNVMWELGLRHASSKSGTIIISQTLEEIPSDLKNYNFIPYKSDQSDFEKFRLDIKQCLSSILSTKPKIDSPWFDFGGSFSARRRDIDVTFRVGYKSDSEFEEGVNKGNYDDLAENFESEISVKPITFDEPKPNLKAEELFLKHQIIPSDGGYNVNELNDYHVSLKDWSISMATISLENWESKRIRALAIPVLPSLNNNSEDHVEDAHVIIENCLGISFIEELPDLRGIPVIPKKPKHIHQSQIDNILSNGRHHLGGLSKMVNLASSISSSQGFGPPLGAAKYLKSNLSFWGPSVGDGNVQYQTDNLRQGWSQSRWNRFYIVAEESFKEGELNIEITAKNLKGIISKKVRVFMGSDNE